jgi:hypothetical protein
MTNIKITSLGLCLIMILTILPTITAFNIDQIHQKLNTTNYEEKYYPSDLSDNEYDGHIRVYVVEIESRWNNNDDEPYHYGFLDFALNEDFSLHNEEDIYNNTIIWESKWAGYPIIELENILVIAAIFNSEENIGYSEPPNGNPFDAYYVDATAAAKLRETGTNTDTDNFTHTVLIEEGTATWCGACPTAANALYNIFQSNDYPFYFVALIEDENYQARNRLLIDYNIQAYPTMYFDGGYEVLLGGHPNESIYRDLIESSGQRDVYSLNLSLNVRGIEENIIGINISISKKEEVINHIPLKPTIYGPDQGNTGEEQIYTFSTTDPDDHDILYHVDWGDQTEETCIGPFPSGEEQTLSHTWIEDGNYTIRIKAQDIKGAESEYSTMQVSMPKTKELNNQFLQFLKTCPYLFSILLKILGLN